MLSIEEVKKWLLKNRVDEDGNLDLSGLDFSDFGGGVKGSISLIIHDFGSLNDDFKKMSPAEKGDFIVHVFGGDDGKIHIENVDLSDFKGDVVVCGWKVGGDLFLDHQEVKGSLFQNNQKVGRNLFQDEQEAGGFIAQDDMQDMPIVREDEDECVEPDYKAEWEKLQKELHEADKKNDALMWALGKAMEASKEGQCHGHAYRIQ